MASNYIFHNVDFRDGDIQFLETDHRKNGENFKLKPIVTKPAVAPPWACQKLPCEVLFQSKQQFVFL